jgi:lysozyme family protein
MSERSGKFIRKILVLEGGSKITNDPSDSGGQTKYGISKKAFPNVNVINLTEQQAIDIYKNNFYNVCMIDSINDELLALHVFDFAVNAGIGRSVKTLQKIVGSAQDGVIGAKTLSMVNSGNFSTEFIQARINFYKSIGVGKNAKFLKGWLNRVSNLKV